MKIVDSHSARCLQNQNKNHMREKKSPKFLSCRALMIVYLSKFDNLRMRSKEFEQDSLNNGGLPNDGLLEEERQHFDQLLTYSQRMTQSLFNSQLHCPADSLMFVDSRTTKRRSWIRRIKVLDQYGDLTKESEKSSHPLSRPRPCIRWEKSNPTKTDNLSVMIKPVTNAYNTPEWHPPWKLYKIIKGSGGWVHSLTVDPANMWFASGTRDGLIKIYDLASCKLRLTLTGHISGVRGLAVSHRHPYLYSCADDKKVKCWDLEQNQVVRHYHGHLSGVYCLSLHPTENILVTGGRDSVARVWDMRTKEQIHCLTGHRDTVGSVICQANDPQIITGSYDTTIRLWDLKMARTLTTLTNHKKSVRSIIFDHGKSSFASGATDNIKQWSMPDGEFIQNLSGHNSIINCLATNKENVLVSGADNGTIFFWDWKTGYNFQRLASPIQPGSIESEAGILSMTFDQSGARLITGETDKTIKIFREDPNATEKTHPINWKPNILKRSFF